MYNGSGSSCRSFFVEAYMLRYRCLVLDHDDTVTDSTAHIHYPAFLDVLSQMRPGVWMSLQDYFRINFEPGFLSYIRDVLHFTDDEITREYGIWQSWVRRIVPKVYPGMADVIRRQKAGGGYVCVVSHSVDFNIRRDYRENGLPEPDLVYGWERPAHERKPEPFALYEIQKKLGVKPEEMLMVDDLKPGFDMARAAGVPFAAACWAYDVPEIKAFMARYSPLLFETPEALLEYLFI